ncbi:Uncharacterised protein [Salmonella enterica subsp. enterica]|uniref:Uncharacterized protein n=1 Tax=Salmonella enterica I TaxID=59201 RepID=A0A379US99_SALET|nr:Uncharacterised protein [Salmonella enterica subsp. enterica]
MSFCMICPQNIGSTTIPIVGQDTRGAAQSSYQVTNAGPGYAGKYQNRTTGQYKGI